MNSFRIRFLVLLVLAGFTLSHAVEPKVVPKLNEKASAPTLVLSELTVGTTLGSDGSWVELYNSSDTPIAMEGVSLIVAGKQVKPFVKGQVLAEKSFVVVRFFNLPKKQITLSEWVSAIQSQNFATTYHAPVTKQAKLQPGFCALYRTGQSDKTPTLIDYVHWGASIDYMRLKQKFMPSIHYQRAVKVGCWDAGKYIGVRIGIDPRPGEILAPGHSMLTRVLFDPVHGHCESWVWRTEKDVPHIPPASPGKANTMSRVYMSPSGWTFGRTDKIGFSVQPTRYECTAFWKQIRGTGKTTLDEEALKTVVHLQVSKDPHFQTLVYETRCSWRIMVADSEFQAGKYFVRGRYACKNLTTSWSEPSMFYIER